LNPDKPGTATSSAVHSTNINIQNNQTAGNADEVSQTNVDISVAARKTKEGMQEVSRLQSIVHVLQASGAFQVAQQTNDDLDDTETPDGEGVSDDEFEASYYDDSVEPDYKVQE
jgi:N-acetyl-gamma-glutamylphosphate reductase